MANRTPLLRLLAVLMLCLIHFCSGCVERERRALLSFKRSLIDPSNRLSSWVGQNCCQWVGVECNNKTAHVVKLDLQNPHPAQSDDDSSFSSLVGSTVDPSLMELKHLEYLDLSFNNFAGSEIPKFIGNFTKLRHLALELASFGGAVPESLGNLSKLEELSLFGNSLTGVVSEIHFDRLSRLEMLDLAANSLVFKISSNWTPPFQLHSIVLDDCVVGPRFPHWLRNQSRITDMYLTNASIFYSIPEWFPNIASKIEFMDLSYNQIHGLVPDLSRNITNSLSLILHLSSNNLEGPLPPFPSNTVTLDISNNFISGSLPQNISDMMPNLRMLLLSNNSISGSIPTTLCRSSELNNIDLSNNKFSGEIPRNCWSNLEGRSVLGLANNNLAGVIPSTNFSDMCGLVLLSLSNNKLYGEIPSALRNCDGLEIFDIGENGFSGNIPSWIGRLSQLRILRLRSNKFEGGIAAELCRAKKIRILDLAKNKFSGAILPCFKNFTGMKLGDKVTNSGGYNYLPGLTQVMKGRELYYTSVLSLLANLDLSSNNLQGLIPKELTLLTGLYGLNLSNNHLTGEIPQEIGNLRLLESLDFSNNLLTGTITQSISELTSISYLDLSYNNLSGRIPTGNQLQTLEPWIYRGNPSLCGMQIEKLCAEDEPIRRNDADTQVKDGDFEMVWFYISMIIGFVVGFWGVWGVLFCKKAWRATYFRFVENVHDLTLVKVKQMCRA